MKNTLLWEIDNEKKVNPIDYFHFRFYWKTNFNMTTFDCLICLELYPISDGYVLCSPFNNKGNARETHTVCIECIKGFAQSAIGDSPVAEGGVGLRCPVPECNNVLLIGKLSLYYNIKVFHF